MLQIVMLKVTVWFFDLECNFFVFPPFMISRSTVCTKEGLLCFICDRDPTDTGENPIGAQQLPVVAYCRTSTIQKEKNLSTA